VTVRVGAPRDAVHELVGGCSRRRSTDRGRIRPAVAGLGRGFVAQCPSETTARELVRVLPDTVRLVSRLGRDGTLPWGVRIRHWLLMGYLIMPVDLVPDFIPIIGYAGDAVVVAVVLRSVVRRAGADAVERHWPGTPEGLAAVVRLARL
jgi:uncharacterized membrane protein YkvA (DUF1232 family)